MVTLTPVLSTIEPDPVLLKKLVWVKRASLALVALIAGVTLAGWLLPAVRQVFPSGWQLMKAETSLAALLSAFCLMLSEPWRSRRMHRLSLLLAALVTLLSMFVLVEYGLHLTSMALTRCLPLLMDSPPTARQDVSSNRRRICAFGNGLMILILCPKERYCSSGRF